MTKISDHFKQKSIVVTGASSGLGKVLAVDFAKQGARLALADRDAEALEETREEIASLGAEVLAQPTDVTDEAQCRVLIQKTVERFERVDYLVLCAGISMWARFEEINNLALFRKLMDVNFLGVVNCVHPALRHLTKTRGSIVTVSSTQGVIGLPNHSAYSASKHAVNGFLEALEFEMGDKIRVLNVLPGWIRGTSLRANALGADGNVAGRVRKHNKESVSVEDCSKAILEALARGDRHLYLPWKLKFIPWVKLIAPGWLGKKIRKAVDDQEDR